LRQLLKERVRFILSPFRGFGDLVGSAIGSVLDLMSVNICCAARTKRANASCHLCVWCNPHGRIA